MTISTTLDRPDTAATDPRTPLRLALTDCLAVSAGMIAFGIALGITIVTFSSSRLAGLIGGALVYGGSAQLTAITLLHGGVGIAAATATAAVVNLRLVLYSVSLAERFRPQPAWFRWLAPYFIIDQTYLMSTTRPELTGSRFRRYWTWLGVCVLVVWVGSISLGMLAGPLLPPLPHLGLAGTALFVGLLVPRLTDRPAVLAALVGGLVAGLVSLALPSLGIIAGALAGVIAALRFDRPTQTSENSR